MGSCHGRVRPTFELEDAMDEEKRVHEEDSVEESVPEEGSQETTEETPVEDDAGQSEAPADESVTDDGDGTQAGEDAQRPAEPDSEEGEAVEGESEASPAPRVAFCRKCGSPLEPGQQFCSACGAPASGEAAHKPADEAKRAVAEVAGKANGLLDKLPVPKPVALGGAVVILAAIAFVLFTLLAPFDFSREFAEYEKEDWCDFSRDGDSMTISGDDEYDMLVAIIETNDELGFPDRTSIRMLGGNDGSDEVDGFEVEWERDDGLEVTYERV